MKTLIIHPNDRSTDFLKPIYHLLPRYTVITSGTKDEVNKAIKEHDRILMMGHGSPHGLFGVGQFNYSSYIIDKDTVELLRGKECVFIWCNADKFVTTHNLKGLYSGMFISEQREAEYCDLPMGEITISMVNESNELFAFWFGKELTHYIKKENTDNTLREMYNDMLKGYQHVADCNLVAQYNIERLYLAE